ncbi:hypothetical protein SARC_05505 [Sphaeroforma arctica JP610]|uniref:Uncharacterized protein n=1 Tax=Sphaeroforma arctica JP610 TaxID=667725 RepID=A0A0L0FZE7_9EUKA|nr:hypothetical protein SARC_05505 [Sphaeroforma arctica JP610]KNC82207.1 hypothetical protein SARC_05505 [Sphaeroforma arctica JP610]|eukprot:XP_014156109.1 hypothetical protein SARC_05505 [Sphaeroforma arctica JP610]
MCKRMVLEEAYDPRELRLLNKHALLSNDSFKSQEIRGFITNDCEDRQQQRYLLFNCGNLRPICIAQRYK